MAKKQEPTAANGHADAAAIDTTEAPTTSAKSEFLKLFWTLAESDVATRTKAAAALLAYLRNSEDDVQYTLKRLVRGLASSRDAARQGFSAALVALLVEFPKTITLSETLATLKESMELSASMKPMEQREHMFGKLFGLLALQRSGRLASDDDVTVAVLTELVEMSKWKKWLREACVEAMLTVLSDVSKKLFVSRVAALLSSLIEGEDVATFNADQVSLAVGLQHYIQSHKIQDSELPNASKYPALHFVRRKHLHVLAEPLKHSTVCFPRVHGVWFGLFGHIMHAGSDGAKLDSELFQEAWTVLVENLLLNGPTATHERKGLALKIFELVVPSLPSAVLRAILTPNLVKCLFNNTLSKKTYLHDAARHTLKAFAAHAPEEFFHFFQREFVKPMAVLVESSADDEGDEEELKEAVKGGGFDAIIAIEEERERQLARLRKHATVRLWALEHMSAELTDIVNGDDEKKKELRDRVLHFLTFHAFFTPSAKKVTPSKKSKKAKAAAAVEFEAPEPVLSSQVRDAVVKKIFSLLSVKLTSATDATLATVFTTLVQWLESGSHELLVALNDEQRKLLASVQTHVVSLREKKDKEPTDDAFLLLFMSCALRLADASQRSEAQGVVADLEQCFVDIQKQKETKTKKSPAKKSPSKKQKEQPVDEEAEAPVDAVVVLTDLLLSLLSQDSSAMREIVTHVFRDLVPLMNTASLQTLVAAIAPAAPGDEEDNQPEDDEEGDEDMEGDDDMEGEEEEDVVLSSATDIADALRTDANLADLHREDQTLSAIVGQVKTKAKAKKDAKKHRLHVLHFKLRVVDLLSLYATAVHKTASVVSSSNAVRLVLPLFESLAAIASSDVEQRVLKERLQAVLLHKFVQTKTENATALSTDDREHALTSLERVCELLSKKALDKELANKVGTAVVLHLVRSLLTPEIQKATLAKVNVVVRAMAVEVFTKKHAKFPRGMFEELATKSPKVAVHVLLPSLTEIASATEGELAAVDDFSKAEVFRLLSLLLKAKHLSDASERKVFDASRQALLDALVALLQQKKQESEESTDNEAADAKKSNSEMKAKRVKVFLSFALHLVRMWTGEAVATAPVKDLKTLVGVAQSLETSSPVVKSMVKQLTQAAGYPVETVEATKAAPAKKEAKKETKKEAKKETKKSPAKAKTAGKNGKKSTTPTKRKRADDDEDA